VFLIVVPGVVAGLIPWQLTGWGVNHWPLPIRLAGLPMIIAGLGVLVDAFARFALEGLGTPAPIAPTRSLVIRGAYRYVRNPMYLAVAMLLVGQGLLLGQPGLLVYAAAFGIAVALFVRVYEEPTLARRFGAQYEAYRRSVPAWRPRVTPWAPRTRDPGGLEDRAGGRG